MTFSWRPAVTGPSIASERDESWHERAACRDEDGERFFPLSYTGAHLVQIAEVKLICAACPVRERCLVAALEFGESHGALADRDGIFGGLTPAERAKTRALPWRDLPLPGASEPKCPQGHPWRFHLRTNPDGYRYCALCSAAQAGEAYERRKQMAEVSA